MHEICIQVYWTAKFLPALIPIPSPLAQPEAVIMSACHFTVINTEVLVFMT